MKYASVKGRPSIYRVSMELMSPKLAIIKTALKLGHQFTNQSAPRYYAVCRCDPQKCDEFLSNLENLRLKEQAEIFLQQETKKDDHGTYETTGNYVLKFTSKEKPKIFAVDGSEYELKTELPPETPVTILFDTMCYFDKTTSKYKFTFPLKKIYLLDTDASQEKI